MTLSEEVRSSCAHIAANAQHVRIDLDAAARIEPGLDAAARIEPGLDGWAPAMDPERHYLEGSQADVADYLLALDAINFGSGWVPLLRKRPADGRPVSGYFTVAWNLADHVRAHSANGQDQRSERSGRGERVLSPAWLRQVSTSEIATILDQPPDLELMSLYAQALRQLGHFLGERRALDLIADCTCSAERLAHTLAHGMAMFGDRP